MKEATKRAASEALAQMTLVLERLPADAAPDDRREALISTVGMLMVSGERDQARKLNAELRELGTHYGDDKATAMAMLRAKLLEAEERRRQEEIAKEKGEAQDVNFGSQIRSYVLHPYSMVKDHRTDFEMGDVQRVLGGDLDGFVRAYLLKAAGGGSR